MPIRLICLDLDGTTLRRDGRVSDRTIHTLRRAMDAGVTVAIATGRIHASASHFAEQIGINGPVISSNGARIQDRAGRMLHFAPMPPSIVPAVIQTQKATGLQMDLFAQDALYTPAPALKRWSWIRWQWRHVHSLAGLLRFFRRIQPPYPVRRITHCNEPVEKLFIGGNDPAALQRAYDHLAAAVPEPLTLCSSGPDNLEVTAHGVSKGSAVAWLAAQIGAELGEVMVAGDSMNDLSMFELDCFKVAMGNAEPAIIERASHVTAHHNDDGVALAVERFVLGEGASA